jgi:hypothetical protein
MIDDKGLILIDSVRGMKLAAGYVVQHVPTSGARNGRGGRAMSQQSNAWTPKIEQLLQDWRTRVYTAQAAYYEEAERLKRRSYQLGIPVVIVSSLVGTAVFADWGKDGMYKWGVGSVSILAAVLASLQTFLKFGENAALHAAAADWFAAIRRDIEEMLALPADLRGSPKDCLDSVRQEMNKAGQKAPELRESMWKRVARRFGIEEPPCTAHDWLQATDTSGPSDHAAVGRRKGALLGRVSQTGQARPAPPHGLGVA